VKGKLKGNGLGFENNREFEITEKICVPLVAALYVTCNASYVTEIIHFDRT